MEFKAWMKREYIKELMVCSANVSRSRFGMRRYRRMQVALLAMSVVVLEMLVMTVLPVVKNEARPIDVLLVVVCLLPLVYGAMVMVFLMIDVTYKRAYKAFDPKRYDRTVRLDKKGISVTMDDGGFSVFTA